jgi:hypothetical protein
MAWSASWLLSLLATFTLVGGPFLPVRHAAALDPPNEHTVVSRGTLLGPLDIAVSGPSDLELAQLTIEPGGTTGVRRYAGPALVSVAGGTASRYQIEAGSCRPTIVPPGVAYFVSPGQVDEIRNQGPLPLQLQTTSLAPSGEPWASASPAMPGCGMATMEGVTVGILSHTAISGPVHIKTDSPTDILTGRWTGRPGTSVAGWHSHPSATLVSVGRGTIHVMAVEEGRCVRRAFSGGTGYVQLPEVHDDRNGGRSTATIYYVGLSSSAGPVAVPGAPPPQCNTLR